MPATFGELKKYCENNGWEMYRNSDHWYYRKIMPNGEVLTTRISHAIGKEIPKVIWEKILKKQLKVTEREFWENIKGE